MSRFVMSRTPFRISFFGGGTDYQSWCRHNEGAVLSSSIDKYCYIMGRWLPPFFSHRHSIAWSYLEHCQDASDILHPSVRETMKFLGIERGLEMHHMADLPARTGIGSSSSFTVGLLNVLHGLKGDQVEKMPLAREAIKIEQDLIGENVGSQDQVSAAVGGFNRIDFSGNEIKVSPIKSRRILELEGKLLLFFTGFSRSSSALSAEYIRNMGQNRMKLKRIYSMVSEAERILTEGDDLNDFGRLLHQGWLLKRRLSEKISNDQIDDIYRKARRAGALGGKLCGAGGGGFMIFFVEQERQLSVKKALSQLLEVPFKFDSDGSQLIFNGR